MNTNFCTFTESELKHSERCSKAECREWWRIGLTNLFLQVVRWDVWAVRSVPGVAVAPVGCWPARDDRWAVVGAIAPQVLCRGSGDDGEDDNESNLESAERRTKRALAIEAEIQAIRAAVKTHHWFHFEFLSWVWFSEESKSLSFSKLLEEFDFEANWWILARSGRLL